jgi:hypothetical protein
LNDLKLLIESLNDDEAGGFLAFAKARNKRSHTHNITLFKLLRAGKTRHLDLEIYGTTQPNAMYALKNRLRNSLVEFIGIQGFQNGQKEEMSILKWLLAARILLEKGLYKIGYRLLQKCEAHATQSELYPLLNEIYLSILEHSHHFIKVDINHIEHKFQANQVALQTSNKIALLFARYKNSPKELPADKVSFINKQLEQSQVVINQRISFKNLYQLLEIATDAATAAGNYQTVAPFVEDIYTITQEKKAGVPKNLWYYLEVLFLVALTYFRTRNFIKSRELLVEINTYVSQEGSSYKNHFSQNTQLLHALCLHYTGKPVAAMKRLEDIRPLTFEASLTLVMCLLQDRQHARALRIMNTLKHTDAFYEKHHAPALVLKKNLLELLLYVDLEKWDLADSRLNSLKKKRKELHKFTDPRISAFIKLVESYCNNPAARWTPKFQKAVDQLTIHEYEEDVFAVSVYAWLKSKINKESWYTTTLELLSRP